MPAIVTILASILHSKFTYPSFLASIVNCNQSHATRRSYPIVETKWPPQTNQHNSKIRSIKTVCIWMWKCNIKAKEKKEGISSQLRLCHVTRRLNSSTANSDSKSSISCAAWFVTNRYQSYNLPPASEKSFYHPFFRANRLFRSASTFGTLNCTYSRSRSSWLSFCISRRSSSFRSSSNNPRLRPI